MRRDGPEDAYGVCSDHVLHKSWAIHIAISYVVVVALTSTQIDAEMPDNIMN